MDWTPPRNPDNPHRKSRQEPHDLRSSGVIWPDFAGAITRNQALLLSIVALLFRMAGMQGEQPVSELPRQVRNAVLRLLRPAESAARRLIVIAAREVPAPPAPMPVLAISLPRLGQSKRRPSVPAFRLFDPRMRLAPRVLRPVAGAGPRLSVPGVSDPAFAPQQETPAPDSPVSAERLSQRLQSLRRALDDLPGQVQRLARLKARRKRSPLRPGRPPGHRARPSHEIDAILKDCHELALWATAPPDTS